MIPVYRDYSSKESGELHKGALAYMRAEEQDGRTINYRDALKHVMHNAARNAQRRQYQQAGDWAPQESMNADKTGAEAYLHIGNLVRALPRESDGAIDSTKAAESVNLQFDAPVVFAAVSHVIGVRQAQIWKNMLPGATNQNMSAALRQTLAEQPPLGES